MSPRLVALLFFSTILALPAPLFAQTPDSANLKFQKPDSTRFTADLKYVSTAGNASSKTLGAGDLFTQIAGRWAVAQEFRVIYGKSSGAVLANFYHGSLRLSYATAGPVSAIAYGIWDRDTPAGLVSHFEEGVGLSFRAIQAPRDKLEFDAGPAFVQERRVPASNQNYAAGRFAAVYSHAFTKKATFDEAIAFLPDLSHTSNYQVTNHTALAAPLGGIFALALSYDVRYVNLPPAGKQKSDRFFTAGMQITP